MIKISFWFRLTIQCPPRIAGKGMPIVIVPFKCIISVLVQGISWQKGPPFSLDTFNLNSNKLIFRRRICSEPLSISR